MPTNEAVKTKENQIQATHRQVVIQADSDGQLPDRIELVKTGEWPDDSNKGFLEITRGDLLEMKANFEAGLSMPKDQKQLAVDFMHQDYDKAAIWIGSLEVEGDTLYGGTLEYTKSGREALLGGEFKRLSPSFYPRCRGSWHDPENWSITAENVIVGAALTNIPFFKGLKPITASAQSQEGRDEDILFVDADAKGANMPTLDEVRAKDFSALTEDDKTLLTEQQDQLTADEKVKFGFDTAPVVVTADATKTEGIQLNEEDQKILADVRDGKKVLVDASVVTEHEALKASVTRLEASDKKNREEKVEAAVEAAVEAGKIKSDQAETWTNLIMADSKMEQVMNDLTENKLLSKEIGNNNGVDASAVRQLEEKAQEKITASRENGGTALNYGDAMSQARRENTDLANAADAEMKGE